MSKRFQNLTNGKVDPALVTNVITADDALQLLNEGQSRYLHGQTAHNALAQESREILSRLGQSPIATVLACSDSRQPVELIFDMGIGDLFTIRIPGNVPTDDIIGSVEFGVSFLKTPLCIVLGHTQCGAVTAALEGVRCGNKFDNVLDYMSLLVEKGLSQCTQVQKDLLLNKAVQKNVHATINKLISSSPVIEQYVEAGALLIKGGVYDIALGSVDWIY